LQPILAQVERAIQRAALTGVAERARVLVQELASIEAALDGIETQFNLDAWAAQAEIGTRWPAPVTLPELAAIVRESPALWMHFHPHETLEGAYWLDLDGRKIPVTFDRQRFDEHPNTLQLLTYGNPLWERLLEMAPPIEPGVETGAVLRVAVETPLQRVAYYARDAKGALQPLHNVQALRQALAVNVVPPPWPEACLAEAYTVTQTAAEVEWKQIQAGKKQLREARHAALLAQAGRLLLDATLIELALGQQLSLLDVGSYPLSFDGQAVANLKRHGYPWAGLVRLLQQEDALSKPQPTDPFFMSIQGNTAEQLKRQFEPLTQQAKQLLKDLVACKNEA